MRHVTHTEFDIGVEVMSHIRMSHVTHVKESCHTYEGVTSHKQAVDCHHAATAPSDANVTYMYMSCHMYV